MDVMMQTYRRCFLQNDRFLYHAFQREMQLETCSCLPSCAHICKEWWILEDGLNDKVSITDKNMQFNKCLIMSYLSRVCHGTAISPYASFLVSRGTRLSSIQVAARVLTSLCMCVCECVCCWCCECSPSSSRQFRTHSVRAEALLPSQLHVKQEGVAEAVHTIKTENRSFCHNIAASTYNKHLNAGHNLK